MRCLILYVGSLALGGVGAWVISRWGTTIGILDRADERSSHEGVVPVHRFRRPACHCEARPPRWRLASGRAQAGRLTQLGSTDFADWHRLGKGTISYGMGDVHKIIRKISRAPVKQQQKRFHRAGKDAKAQIKKPEIRDQGSEVRGRRELKLAAPVK